MRSPAARKLLSLAVLFCGAAASIATSERIPPPAEPLVATATGPSVVLGSGGMLATHTITVAINDEAVPEDTLPFGAMYLRAGACVAEPDVPGRLRVTVIPEFPSEGTILEADVASICPAMTPFELDLALFTTCTAGAACAERYDVELQRFGLVSSAMTAGFTVEAMAGGFDDGIPEGAELTVVVE